MAPGLMLAVHCKKSEPLDLKEPIADYIARTYGPQVRVAHGWEPATQPCSHTPTPHHALLITPPPTRQTADLGTQC